MSQGQDILQREQSRSTEETGLSTLLDDFRWNADGARGDLA
jgi:hypothetical protein